MGAPKITTRFLSVRVTGRSEGLFDAEWPRVRVEVQAGGQLCSMPVIATYGFNEATGEVALRAAEGDAKSTEPNTIALMLTNKTPQTGLATIRLLDAVTGVELRKLENVEVSIAI